MQLDTASARIHDVSSLLGNSGEAADLITLIDFIELIEGLVEPETWINSGGAQSGALAISGHVVIVATIRVHLEIEALLDGLADAIATELPWSCPYQSPEHPRAFRISSECGTGFLDNIRVARAISIAALRSAGPTLDDGVTVDELDTGHRAAFGLLDALRDPASPVRAARPDGERRPH